MYFKKITILLLTVFLLFSCSWEDTEKATPSDENTQEEAKKKAGLRHFPGKDFSIKIPAAWNEITTNKNIIPTPNNGNLELAITSSETKMVLQII